MNKVPITAVQRRSWITYWIEYREIDMTDINNQQEYIDWKVKHVNQEEFIEITKMTMNEIQIKAMEILENK